MPENLYPQLPTAPPIIQESVNIEMVRKYYQDIANLKEQYTEKQWKYKNAYNRLLHASTGASSVALVSGVSTIGTSVTIVGFPITANVHDSQNGEFYFRTVFHFRTNHEAVGSRTGSGAFSHVPLNWFLPENHCFLDVHFLQNCHSRMKKQDGHKKLYS